LHCKALAPHTVTIDISGLISANENTKLKQFLDMAF
jgi:hypothetical protein